jgi:hypothetical protein
MALIARGHPDKWSGITTSLSQLIDDDRRKP